MFSDRDLNEAARLDQLWDGIAGQSPGSIDPFAQFIRELEEGVPTMSLPQRDRILRMVRFPSHEALGLPRAIDGVAAPLDHFPLPSRPQSKRGRLDHPVLQIAATILLLIGIASTWFLIRQSDSANQSPPNAIAASPSPQGQSQSAYLASLDVPRSETSQQLTIIIRRIVLSPGTIWQLGSTPSVLSSRGLGSGSVRTRDDDGYPYDINVPSGLGSDIVSIENVGKSDAVIFELSVSEYAASLAKVPEGTTADVLSISSYTTISGQGATFILTRAVGDPFANPAVNPEAFPAILGMVESGLYRWSGMLPLGDSTPGAVEDTLPGHFSAGAVIEAREGAFPELFAESENSAILLLSVRAVTAYDVAEWGTTSKITSNGEPMWLDLNMVTIEPGGSFSFRMDGSVLAWGLSGTASIASDLNTDAVAIVPELFSTATWATKFTISALGNQPATFVLARVSRDPVEEVESESATFALSASGQVAMPVGVVEARLYLSGASGYSSRILDREAQMGLVSGGEIVLSPGTEMTVTTGDESQDLAAFSEPITLKAGDSYVAAPGDGYVITPNDRESQVINLVLRMIGDDYAYQPSPVAGSAPQLDQPIDVRSDECTVAPRSLDDYVTIFATPYADGNGAVSHDDDTSGTPASKEQIEGITGTMRQVVACGRAGGLYQLFSLDSEAQLQYQASVGQMNIGIVSDAANSEESERFAPPIAGQLLISDAQQFSDGRVGAWVFVQGSTAYVTFVFESGRWLIDFWDETSSFATPIP